MTDKQIIIDGVDVSGCEFYESNGMCSCSLVYYDYCKDFPNCVYKLSQKLKAKEQECERLKEEIKTNGFGMFNISMQEQLDQLKAENEELKRELMQYEKDVKDLNYFAIKLKQTLTEIKEIAEDQKDLLENMRIDVLEQILEKISEVV